MLKNATHKGDVERGGKTKEVWLRETPKGWMDGRRRWKKFYRNGEPEVDPTCHVGSGWAADGYTLKTTTIRPLTASDLRGPFEEAVALAERGVERAQEKINEGQRDLDAARVARHEAKKALGIFNRKNAPAEWVDSDGNRGTGHPILGSGKAQP